MIRQRLYLIRFVPETETNDKLSIRIRFDSVRLPLDSIRFDLATIIFHLIRFTWAESNRIELFAYSVRFRSLLDNEDFIVIDHHNPRYLTFGTLQSLENLCSSDHILLDSTFKSCASPFVHLYTSHAQSSVLNGTVSILYSLLPSKTKSIYTSLFDELRTATVKHDLVLNSKFITIDFEKGAVDALKNVFPNAVIKGCHFHYNQCITI